MIVVITITGITCLGDGQVERLRDPGVGQTKVKDLTLPERTVELLNYFKPLSSNQFNEKSVF